MPSPPEWLVWKIRKLNEKERCEQPDREKRCSEHRGLPADEPTAVTSYDDSAVNAQGELSTSTVQCSHHSELNLFGTVSGVVTQIRREERD